MQMISGYDGYALIKICCHFLVKSVTIYIWYLPRFRMPIFVGGVRSLFNKDSIMVCG